MNRIGWLTPSAELVKCNEYGHLDTARRIVKQLNLEDGTKQPDDILIAHGWIRISRFTYGDRGITFWTPRCPTAYQKEFLRSIYNDDPTDISKVGLNKLMDLGIVDTYELY